MPHLDYLTYLSQVFWFLLFFWAAYSLFFFVFFPKLYYSFRIRKLKFDFLFDKYISSEYKINFYSFFFKDYSEKFTNVIFSFLKDLKARYNLALNLNYKKFKILSFLLNVFLVETLYLYWSKGVSLNFSSFLIATFFYDKKKVFLFNKLNSIY